MTRFNAVPVECGEGAQPRNSIGGDAIVSSELQLPECNNCGEMFLFLQFDIDAAWQTPFIPGSRFSLFMCTGKNEIPSFEEFPGGQLPPEFWNHTEGHFYATLTKPGDEQIVKSFKPILKTKELKFELSDEQGYLYDAIRIGGEPNWLQDPERFISPKGQEMVLLAQISENYAFAKRPDAPEQPDSFSADDYCLFLGNEVYIFACPDQYDPRAVWITVQG